MIFKVLDFKKGVQSLRLQRLSVEHSINEYRPNRILSKIPLLNSFYQ